MSKGPPPFSEIGKRVRDLLTKDYNFNNKFTLTTSSDANVGLTATGVKIDQIFVGDIATRYRSGKTTVDVKVDTSSNISTTVTVNEVVAGAKTSLSFRIPDHNSCKVDVQYLHDLATINSSIGLTATPTLEVAAAIGNNEVSVGAEVGLDSASATLTKYNVGVSYNKHDFSVALLLTDKGETLTASYIHVINPKTGTSVGAELINRFNTYEKSFTIGSSHYVDPLTMLKTRFSNTCKASFLCQHEWRPKSFLTISAEYDPQAVHAPSKLGVALALKP